MNKSNKSFGSFIREIRISKDIGQRKLAEKIGIAASYLNDIEKNKRSAPKINIIKKISSIFCEFSGIPLSTGKLSGDAENQGRS